MYRPVSDDVEVEPSLCCCEYVDRHRERNHIAACCCNCVDLDSAFDRLICCKSVPHQSHTNMLLTFQDRLRLPWQGGAKQVSLQSLIPFIVIPTGLCVAALSIGWTCFVAAAFPAFVWYIDWRQKYGAPRSKFYLMWNIVSVAVLWLLFEATVPLLEVLPVENFALIVLMTASCFCFYKVKQRAPLSHVAQSTSAEGSLPDITEVDEYTPDGHTTIENDDVEASRPLQTAADTETEDDDESTDLDPNMCPRCRKYTPPRTFHCGACQVCVQRMDHHNVWLDCCIGQSNYRLYFLGGLFGIFACALGANLALTSICHPFLVWSILGIYVFLPDDCSEVYEQYDVALCFVGALYTLILALILLVDVLRQLWFITRGVTWEEHLRGETAVGSRRQNAFQNWKAFICLYRG